MGVVAVGIRIDFTIKELPLMSNGLLRRHWSFIMKEKQKWHNLVGREIQGQKLLGPDFKPLEKARITFIRASIKEPDWDGLVSGFKFVTDALTESGVIIDDKPSVITCEYRWVKCKKSEQGIFVSVEGV